jgi:hypothetical protein
MSADGRATRRHTTRYLEGAAGHLQEEVAFSMSRSWKLFRRAVLPVAALGFFACQSDRSPLSPSEDGAPRFVEVNGVKLITLAPGRRLAPAEDDDVKKWVSKLLGATLTTDDVQLIIVPGSMSKSAEIRIDPNNSSNLVEYRFEPTGLRFNPPATLRISVDKADLTGLDVNGLRIAGASDDMDNWQIIGGTYDPLTNSITAPVSHFSRYALCVE